MTYPPDAAMFTLLGSHLRERVVILGGQPVLRITEPGYMGNAVYQIVVKPESLDAIEARKWIDTTNDQPRVTKLGRQAVMTWIRAWKKKQKRTRTIQPTKQRRIG